MALSKSQLESSSRKPRIPIVQLRLIPEQLRQLPQWVLWQYERRDDKWTKVPKCYVPHKSGDFMTNAKASDPLTWRTFAYTQKKYWAELSRLSTLLGRSRMGMGFCLSHAEPETTVTVIDLDDVRNRDTGEIKPWALSIVRQFDTYTEVSPSGTGLKIFAFGVKPGPNVKRKDRPGVEIFDHGRFLAVTGLHLEGTPLTVDRRQEAIDALYAEVFPPNEFPARAERSGSNAPAMPALPLDLTDQQIIDLASQAHNGGRFAALWAGDASAYPSRSEADFALAGMLCFYCGPDARRVTSLMQQSGLRRPKWDRRDATYGTNLGRCVANALAGKTEFYGQNTGWAGQDWRKEIEGEFAGTSSADLQITVDGVDWFGATRQAAVAASTPTTVGGGCITNLMATFVADRQREEAAERDREEQTREAIEAAELRRRERSKLCPNCQPTVQAKKDRTGGRVIITGCDRYDCHVCRRSNIERWQLTFSIRIQNAVLPTPGTMFEFYCPDQSYAYTRQQIAALGGKFYRVASTGMIYSTVAPSTGAGKSARAIDKADAISALSLSVESIPESHTRKHPITHSHGWGFPRPDRPNPDPIFENVGKGHAGENAVELVRQVLADAGLGTEEQGPKSVFSRIRRAIYFHFPGWWGDARKARLFESLMDGETKEEMDDDGPLVFDWTGGRDEADAESGPDQETSEKAQETTVCGITPNNSSYEWEIQQ